MRTETRAERYQKKAKAGVAKHPISLASCNFQSDENVGFLARTLACFGGESLHIVGRLPEPKDLKRCSGGLSDLIDIQSYPNPTDFLAFVRESGSFLVSAELSEESVPLDDVAFPLDIPIIVVVGHETFGVPGEILHRSDLIVHIPMPGVGWCLNTAQTGNIIMYEMVRRLEKRKYEI